MSVQEEYYYERRGRKQTPDTCSLQHRWRLWYLRNPNKLEGIPILPLPCSNVPILWFCKSLRCQSIVHPYTSYDTLLVFAEPSPWDFVHFDQQFSVGNWVPFGVQQANESVTTTQPVETNTRP